MQPDLSRKLTSVQREWIKKGKIENLSDLLAVSPQDWAYKWRTSVTSVNELVNLFLENLSVPQPVTLDGANIRLGRCTTGDSLLDEILDGGIRQGMIWEVVGESAAGKSQVAFQLALCAQLPTEKGGFYGSTCFLTTSSTLETGRLRQIAGLHPLLASSGCSLDYILTQSTPSVPVLLHILQNTLPALIESRETSLGPQPVKLLILDAIGELFHTADKTTTNALVERSKDLSQIGLLLHTLASKYSLAILVLNEVADSFHRDEDTATQTGQLLYRQQSKWFGQPHSLLYEKKEATLGLTWANQINSRIFLSRTGRRRHLDPTENQLKRPKNNDDTQNTSLDGVNEVSEQLVLIRRLTIVFSSICRPASLDYIITSAGVSAVEGSLQYPNTGDTTLARHPDHSVNSPEEINALGGHSTAQQLSADTKAAAEGGDEWDEYWAKDDLNPEPYYALNEEGVAGEEEEEEEVIPSSQEQGVMD